jgi:hypothetical protein
MFRHDASRNVYASAGSDTNPTEKKTNPAEPPLPDELRGQDHR